MPIKLSKPTIKMFQLSKELKKAYGDDPENPTIFGVRQATHRENSLRDAMLATFQRVVKPDGTVEVLSEFSVPALVDYELYLTLASCNIEDEDGNPIFHFRNDRFDGTFEQFRERLGMIPTDIVAYMHSKVLEVNPQWGPEGKKG